MDHERFDLLACALASAISRRGLVGVFAGSVLVGTTATGTRAAARKGKKKRAACRAPRVTCGKGKHAQCCARGQVCASGVCATPCRTCSAECPGAEESNPIKTVAFKPIGDPDFCGVVVNLTGFAGCSELTAEYWSALNLSGFRAKNNGNVALGPTDIAGSCETGLGSFVKGGAVDVRLPGAAAAYQYVDC